MTARTLCRLDRNALGPLLALDGSDSILTTTAVCDASRSVYGTMPAQSGEYRYEVYFWSERRDDLAGLIRYGIAEAGAALTGDTGYRYRVADGVITEAGTVIETVQPQGERVCLGLRLSLSPALCTVTWIVDGSDLHTVTLPNGKAWLPAISIGSTRAGDVSAVVNFGQSRFDRGLPGYGWSQQAPGLDTLYLSLITEAYRTEVGDVPSNKQFGPAVLNGTALSIKRSPQAWFHRTGGRSSAAALTTIQLDNSRGAFNRLRGADVRDSKVVLQVQDSPRHGAGPMSAVTYFTGIVDAINSPKMDVIEVTLRDTLTRFDAPLPCRIIPPFYDESARGRIVPIGLGAQRNITPILLDAPSRLYLFGDAPVTNVGLVSDMAAPLDPTGTPPQYVPALGGAGMQLDTLPYGRLAADVSNVGGQFVIPAIEDVLEGIGEFESWTAGVPDGWTKPAPAVVSSNGSIAITTGFGATGNALRMTSKVPMATTGSGEMQGYYLATAPMLIPGMTYRFSFSLLTSTGSLVTNDKYGLALLTRVGLTAATRPRQEHWITPYLEPLRAATDGDRRYTFVYTVPAGGSNVPLYITCISSIFSTPFPSTATCSLVIDDLRVERLGYYLQAPLEGITLTDAFTEILINRVGEQPGVFSVADTQAIDDAAGYGIGVRWETQPNVLDMLTLCADQFGAVVLTDSDGVVRVRRMTDVDPLSSRATLTAAAGVDTTSLRVWPDTGAGLTTLFSARPNIDPFSSADFVTDTATVPLGIRQQYQQPAQFNFSASAQPAQEYAHAIGAPRQMMRIDDRTAAQGEAARELGLFDVRHTFVSLTVLYDATIHGVAPQSIAYGDVFTLDLPEYGLADTLIQVTETELYPGGRKIKLVGRFAE